MNRILKEKCKTAAIPLLLLSSLLGGVPGTGIVLVFAYAAHRALKEDIDTVPANRLHLASVLMAGVFPLLCCEGFGLLAYIGACAGAHLLFRVHEAQAETGNWRKGAQDALNACGGAQALRGGKPQGNGIIRCSDGKPRSAGLGDGVVIDAEFVSLD